MAFSESMAAALRSGLAPQKSLELSQGRALPPLPRQSDAAARLQQGAGLSEALAAEQGRFPPWFVPVIRCGDEAGRTAEAFAYAADYARTLLPTMTRLREAWLYPLVVYLFGWMIRCGLVAFFLSWRPAAAMCTQGLVAGALLAAIVVALVHIRPLALLFAWLRLQFPLVREIEIDLATARYFKVFNLMYQTSGMRVDTMARYAARTISNPVLCRHFARVTAAFAAGESFADAFGRLAFLQPEYRAEINAGAAAGKLDQSLDRVSIMAADAAHVRLVVLNHVLHRVVVLAVGMSVGATALQIALAVR